MRADIPQIKRDLRECKFKDIFNGIGWDNPPDASQKIPYQGQEYNFISIAQKRGFKIYQHTFEESIPERQRLIELHRELNHYAAAHLTIFVDAKQENQAWLWFKTEYEGDKTRSIPRLHLYNKNQNGESLAQKIDRLFISLDDEDHITLTGVLDRVMQAFDVEKVTKTYYELFKVEHDYFLKNIEGIPDDDEHLEDRKWYTSIMLNRLMFVYFIQSKKILDNYSSVRFDGDQKYLENRLEEVQKHDGPDKFYAFYRHFLLHLFHDGLNKPEPHSPELERIIGKVPHINGGLFDVHDLEKKYPDIKIKDEIFERIFKFFRRFHWHLDDRPMREDEEINPDVLGYTFEKYINQKEMGAYYTKEDITGYISKNTIIPFIFEKVAQRYPDAFREDGLIWSLLRTNPGEYIYEEMAHGLLEPLPPKIEVGIADVEQRTLWNRPAPEQWALPTETWREVVERRQRHQEVHTTISNGEISTINDLITYNLNIIQFARDVIVACKEPGLLRAFYETIESVTVLDPTCGSGAFLFAALNILQPLYQACIDGMRLLIAEYKKQHKVSNHISAFKQIVKRVDDHRNQDYFNLKSIVINNLYGVDIMEEAIEICKLRLFLKLVAQIDTPQQLEPLPDIDFNVLAGNTLIGFTSMDEIRRVTEKLVNVDDTEKTLQLIEQDVLGIERDEQNFRSVQTVLGKIDPIAKQQLHEKLKNLRNKLDPYLATEYSITKEKYPDTYDSEYKQWHKSHKPFHWWAEFYKVICNGGFDVIIGNPPYVEYNKIRKEYQLHNYQTIECGNLYAYVLERSFAIVKEGGLCSMIVQLSSICTDRMSNLQSVLLKKSSYVWISSYDDRPAKLFDKLEHIRASIIIAQRRRYTDTLVALYSTNLIRWYTEYRSMLFNTLYYQTTTGLNIAGSLPKIGEIQLKSLIEKVLSTKRKVGEVYNPLSQHKVYYYRSPLYWIRGMDFLPLFQSATATRSVHHFKDFQVKDRNLVEVVGCLINSSLFYLWFIVYGNGRNVALRDIQTFPCNLQTLSISQIGQLGYLFAELMNDYKVNSLVKERKDGVRYQEFYPSKSKPIIDKIDRILAQHYGFTPEELDFIINYDIKYRMGRDNGEESEE